MNTNYPVAHQLTVSQALEQANALWNAQQGAQAEQLCLQVLQLVPQQPEALNLLGLIAYGRGQLDLAIDYLRRACQAPEAKAICHSNLAEFYRQKGQLAEAEQAVRRALEKAPHLVQAWSNLGIILQEAGNFSASLACLKHVVSLQPGNANAFNNLANTYQRLGDLPQAQENYQRALALRPDYAQVHSNLAFLLSDLGRLDEAVASAERAIAIDPKLTSAYFNLAQIEMSRMRYDDAQRRIDALLAFAPRHVGALTVLASLLLVRGRYQEALARARQALSIAPDDASAHSTLGTVLRSMGRYEEAGQAFDRAATLPGTVAEEALVARAVMYMEAGDKAAATAAFDHALTCFPDSPRVIAARCDNKSYRHDDPDIALMEAALVREPKPSQKEQIVLHFALGKAYLETDNTDRAFFHLDRGNAFKRATFSYDAAQSARWMQNIAAAFTPAVMQRLSGAAVATDQPVFIVGMPRSGTSLVEQILASHPDIYGAGESGALGHAMARAGRFPEDLARWTRSDLARIGRDYLSQFRDVAPDALRVIDKMPGNFLFAGMIPLLLSGARIIHCRRDPVDTCLSCYSKNFVGEQLFSYRLDELGAFYRAYQGLMDTWRKILPADRFIEVDYESVIDDLEGQSRRLVDFVGLPWDDACLSFHTTRRIVRTASVSQVRQPIYTTSRGRWRQHAAHLGPLLAALGMPTPLESKFPRNC